MEQEEIHLEENNIKLEVDETKVCKTNIIETKVCKTNMIETKVNYDTLVLSGGGSKGLLLLGALQCAYDNFLLQNINKYIGTSSGSIICFLLAIGYTPIEIIVYTCTHQLMEKLQHFNVVAMINGGGASSYNSIQEQLEKMTISKLGYLPTLNDIQTRFNKTLICVTYNLTEDKVEYLSPETHPNLPCITALRMSSNIPLIFEKYKYGNNYYIDGGVSDNFPIDLGDRIGEKVLGIQTTNTNILSSDNLDLNIIEYFFKLMFIPTYQTMKLKIKNVSSKCTIITVGEDKITTLNFGINSKTKLDLFSTGYNQFQETL